MDPKNEKKELVNVLDDILSKFVYAAIKDAPSADEAIVYTANYFQNIRRQFEIDEVRAKQQAKSVAFRESLSGKKTQIADFINQRKRRESICAEPYDPEKDKNFRVVIIAKTPEQINELKSILRNSIPIFQSLDEKQINDLVNAMDSIDVFADETIIEENAEGDYFYIIQSGIFEVYTNEKGRIYTYTHRGYFGEFALLYNQPRLASVKAITNGKLWILDRITFRKIVLQNAHKKRMLYENLIKTNELLKNLNEQERTSLADSLNTRSYADGECVIRQNDFGDCMFFILNGEVDLCHEYYDSKDRLCTKYIKTCKKGDYFGDLALRNNKPRSASAYAKGPNVQLAILYKDAFERLIGKIKINDQN